MTTSVASALTQKRILLVEGKDEVMFFEKLLENREIEGIEIVNVQGKGNFRSQIPALRFRTGFHEVEAVGIIQDADRDANASLQSIQDILKNNSFPSPSANGVFDTNEEIKVGIFIMPGSGKGMLEDLCMQTRAEHPYMQCVENFVQCVLSQEGIPDEEKQNNISKVKCKVFLSVMPEFTNGVGRAAEKGYWNLDHQCLEDIVRFLKELAYS